MSANTLEFNRIIESSSGLLDTALLEEKKREFSDICRSSAKYS